MGVKLTFVCMVLVGAVFTEASKLSINYWEKQFGIYKSQSCAVTTSDVLGPYYKPNAPFRPPGPDVPAICISSPAYDRIFLNGTIRILTGLPGDNCARPVKALLDLWQANEEGVYSNISPLSPDYTCRSRVYTSASGTFSIQSIFPGRYDDNGYRPAHIHFRITPVDNFNKPIGKTLTTQVYFTGDHYLSPNDSCQRCGSGNPSQITTVEHVSDIKTYVGSWDVVLSNN